jgi:predicted Zn-dependent protease
MVQINAASPEPWERDVAARTRYYLALAQMVAGQLDVARDNLDLLRRERPQDPDWFEADVLKALVDIDLMLGQQAQAAQLIAPLRPDDRKRRNLAYALQSSSASSAAEARALTELQPALRSLYAGDTAPSARALADLGGLNAAFVEFYKGEVDFMQGRIDAALQHYQKLIGADLPPRYDWFRNIAYLRAAEVQGRRDRDSDAAQVLSDLLDQYSTRDLFRHVIKARRRYFENGKPTSPAVARANGARPISTTSPDSH